MKNVCFRHSIDLCVNPISKRGYAMDQFIPLYLPELHDGLMFHQGVFYADDEGLSHGIACATSEELLAAMRLYRVYKLRIVAADNLVWEIDIAGSAVYAGYYLPVVSSDNDWLEIEDEGDNDE